MPTDTRFDPEVQKVAEDNDESYEDAQRAREDTGQTGPSDEAIKENVEQNVREQWKREGN